MQHDSLIDRCCLARAAGARRSRSSGRWSPKIRRPSAPIASRRSRLRLRARRRVSRSPGSKGSPAALPADRRQHRHRLDRARCRSTAACTTGCRSPSAIRRRCRTCSTATGDTTSSIEDLVIGDQGAAAVGGASRPSLGAAVRDQAAERRRTRAVSGSTPWTFFSPLLVAKTVQSVRVVGNVGLGILGDPTRGDRQNDVLTYGLSFARAITSAAEVVGEINGRKDTRERRAAARHRIAQHGAFRRPLHDRRLARRCGGAVRRHPERSDHRDRRRLHLRLRRPFPVNGPVTKAHAYGNDFLLVPDAGDGWRPGRPGARAVPSPPRHRRGRPHPVRSSARSGHDAAVQRGRELVRALRQRPALPRRAGGAGSATCRRAASSPSTPTPGTRRWTCSPATARATSSARPWGAGRHPPGADPGAGETMTPRSCAWATRSASCSARCRMTAVRRSAPALSTHSMFPAGTNVEFVQVDAPDRVRILICISKGARRLGGLDDMIVSLYAGGMTVRDIQHHLARTLGTELSHDTISHDHRRGPRGGQGLAAPAAGGALPDHLPGRAGGEGPRRRTRSATRPRTSPSGSTWTGSSTCWGSGCRPPRARSSGPGCAPSCATAACATCSSCAATG